MSWKSIKLRFTLPTVEWGFPVAPQHTNGERKSRGVALLMAVMLIALMMLFAADSIVTSQVDLHLAVTHRDRIRAEFAAKSGFNFYFQQIWQKT